VHNLVDRKAQLQELFAMCRGADPTSDNDSESPPDPPDIFRLSASSSASSACSVLRSCSRNSGTPFFSCSSVAWRYGR